MKTKILNSVFVSIFSLLSISSTVFAEDSKFNAKIVKVKNSVELKYGSQAWTKINSNSIGKAGSVLRTGALSKVEVLYPDGTVIRLGSRSVLNILNKNSREIKLDSGNLWFKVIKKSYGLKIHTNKAIATITGTEGGVKIEDVSSLNSTTENKKDANKIDTSLKNGTISMSDNIEEEKNHNLSNVDGVITIGKKKPKTEEVKSKKEITIVVAEGSVSTQVGEKNYQMLAGDKVSFDEKKPENSTLTYVGIDKIKEGFESSEPYTEEPQNKDLPKNENVITNFVAGSISRATTVAVKANMSVIQGMLETYALDNGGYPKNVADLIEASKKSGSFKSIVNPITKGEGIGKAIDNYSKKSPAGGLVFYAPESCTGNICAKYKLYGSDVVGNYVMDKDKPFSLSN
ncbi:MAG: FecR family protein [Cyanobacteriota bacterium]